MTRKISIIFILQTIILLALMGCGSTKQSEEIESLNIAEFYGEYTFDEVAYMRQSSAISDEEYKQELKAVTENFTDEEFTIEESYFYETSGVFGDGPSEGFEFMTMEDYGDKYYDDLKREYDEDFEGISTLFDYDAIKKELDVNEIEHYIMYIEDGILSNPSFYITKDDIFVAMESISTGETEDAVKGYTHYLLKLKKN